MVADRENARKVVKILMDNPDLFYACDTEVADIDLQVCNSGIDVVMIFVSCVERDKTLYHRRHVI